MAEKKIYIKDDNLKMDFVHINLLPTHRSARRFNVNVLFIFVGFIILAYFFVFIPYTNHKEELNTINRLLNEVESSISFAEEELKANEIDWEVVEYQEAVDVVQSKEVNVLEYYSDVQSKVNIIDFNNTLNDGEGLSTFTYNEELRKVEFDVTFKELSSFTELNISLYNLDWVENVEYPEPSDTGLFITVKMTITIGDDIDV